jgi:protein-export membrane protein SecD
MTRNTKILLAILVSSVLLFAYVAPQWVNKGLNWASRGHIKRHVPEKQFSLGLDLLGGAHLLYQADFSALGTVDKAAAMQGVRDVVERRVNYFGVSEPLVQISGEDRLIVEIAGITDISQAIALIGATPLLEFKEQGKEIGKDGKPIQDLVMVDGQLQANPFGEWKSTGLSGKQLKRAQLTFDSQTRRPQVSLELNAEGTQLFADITRRNIGKPVAIFLDNVPISIPTVQGEITDGNAVISGNFTPQEAKLLSTRLNSGALPVPISLISQQTIGASLGAKSLDDSVRAGLWGILLVGVFMIVFYRFPGVTAVLALLVYTLIVLALYKAIPVTLTLAGIAGFILSLGMAVDANILIFARMSEELKAGKSLPVAMTEGFRRAWLSIRDGHVTTLISAIILYAFTTSIVRGFALTLAIGVVASLFSSIVVTRAFLTPFTGAWGQRNLKLFL